jgi:2Fe-2S ferredoxin
VTLKLNVIDRDGNQTTIDIEESTTIKNAIEDELSPDNYGICGECCACGTCHVYIKPSDFDKLKSKEDDEIATLESLALEPNNYSRLGCQVEFKKDYDNITVTIAPD